MTTSPRLIRRGLTLIELVAVLMTLIILGAVLFPTLDGMQGDTHTKAGADVVKTYIAKARSKAIEDGMAYRLAISADGHRVRIAPDNYESLGEMPTVSGDEDDSSSGPVIREDDLPKGVLAVIVNIVDEEYVAQDQSGWRRVATFLPDGTCREDCVDLSVQEHGVTPVQIHLRGITGTSSTTRGGSSP
jgi:Tfp pilus assembly protein FimT